LIPTMLIIGFLFGVIVGFVLAAWLDSLNG
jgi:hypothetical protein